MVVVPETVIVALAVATLDSIMAPVPVREKVPPIFTVAVLLAVLLTVTVPAVWEKFPAIVVVPVENPLLALELEKVTLPKVMAGNTWAVVLPKLIVLVAPCVAAMVGDVAVLATVWLSVPPLLTVMPEPVNVGLVDNARVARLFTTSVPTVMEWEIVTVLPVLPLPICNWPATVHAELSVWVLDMIQTSAEFVKTVAAVPPPAGFVFQLPAVV